MISSTLTSSTAPEWALEETARRACKRLVDAAKAGDFARDEKALFLTPVDKDSFNFTLPNTGVGLLRVRGDLPFEISFFFAFALSGVETD